MFLFPASVVVLFQCLLRWDKTKIVEEDAKKREELAQNVMIQQFLLGHNNEKNEKFFKIGLLCPRHAYFQLKWIRESWRETRNKKLSELKFRQHFFLSLSLFSSLFKPKWSIFFFSLSLEWMLFINCANTAQISKFLTWTYNEQMKRGRREKRERKKEQKCHCFFPKI